VARPWPRPSRSWWIRLAVNDLLTACALMQLGHALHGVTDPLVQAIWRERQG
jgi:hypothetical protein